MMSSLDDASWCLMIHDLVKNRCDKVSTNIVVSLGDTNTFIQLQTEFTLFHVSASVALSLPVLCSVILYANVHSNTCQIVFLEYSVIIQVDKE